MPTANTILQDRAIDRAHDLQRFGVGVVQRIVAEQSRLMSVETHMQNDGRRDD